MNTGYRKRCAHQREEEEVKELLAEQEAKIQERIRLGTWHDPRLDCVAGNGVMSELGVGDEWFGPDDAEAKPAVASEKTSEGDAKEKNAGTSGSGNGNTDTKKAQSEDTQAIGAMPIVILRGFESKGGGARREELLNVMSQWAASLVEGGVG